MFRRNRCSCLAGFVVRATWVDTNAANPQGKKTYTHRAKNIATASSEKGLCKAKGFDPSGCSQRRYSWTFARARVSNWLLSNLHVVQNFNVMHFFVSNRDLTLHLES